MLLRRRRLLRRWLLLLLLLLLLLCSLRLDGGWPSTWKELLSERRMWRPRIHMRGCKWKWRHWLLLRPLVPVLLLMLRCRPVCLLGSIQRSERSFVPLVFHWRPPCLLAHRGGVPGAASRLYRHRYYSES